MHVSEVVYGFLYGAMDLQSVTHESMNLQLYGWPKALQMNYGSMMEQVFYGSKMAECYSSSSESCMVAALLGLLPRLFFLG